MRNPDDETHRLRKALAHKGFSGVQKPKTGTLPKSLPVLPIKKQYSYGKTDCSTRTVRFYAFENSTFAVFIRCHNSREMLRFVRASEFVSVSQSHDQSSGSDQDTADKRLDRKALMKENKR